MPWAPKKAVTGDPTGDRAGAGPGDRGGPPICPPEFCTVLMAWLMPLLMACTAMFRARCGFGGLLGSLLSRVGGSARPVACGMAWRLAVGLLQGTHHSQHPSLRFCLATSAPYSPGHASHAPAAWRTQHAQEDSNCQSWSRRFSARHA